MQSLNDAVSTLEKQFGQGIGGRGAKYAPFTRLPSGIVNLDVGLGGGIPMGAMSLIYGPEGGGKTSLATRLAVQFQRRYPDRAIAWVDVENQFDPDWAKLHGLDNDRIYLFKPTSAEQAADICGEVATSEDAGLLILDSMAAMSTYDMMEKEAEKVVVAGAAKASTTLLRKVAGGMVEHVRAGNLFTFVCINQVRDKVGFVLGNPEIVPGPRQQNFMAFLKLRLTGKPILKEKISPTPIYTENTAKITKKKFPAIRQDMKWETIIYPYQGHKPLDVNNHRAMETILEEVGFLTKEGKDFALHGEVFPTKTAAVQHALENYDDTIRDLVDELLLLYKEAP